MLKNRKTLTEMKTAFSRLIYKHVTAEERIFEPEVMIVEISKTKKWREKKTEGKKKKQNRISKDCRRTSKVVTYA